MFCFKCGKQIAHDMKFCPHCGAEQNIQYENAESIYEQSDSYQEDIQSDTTQKKIVDKKIIAAVCVCSVVAVALLGLYFSKSSNNNSNQSANGNYTTSRNEIVSTEEFVLKNSDIEIDSNSSTDESSNNNTIKEQVNIEPEQQVQEPVVTTPQVSAIRQQVENELAQVEQQAANIEQKLGETYIQTELNQYSGQLFQIWDSYINVLWGHLKANMSESEFDTLKDAQIDWIVEKEDAIEISGDEYGMNMTGYDLTKKRVYQLIEYLP